jgi:hypothetical protein
VKDIETRARELEAKVFAAGQSTEARVAVIADALRSDDAHDDELYRTCAALAIIGRTSGSRTVYQTAEQALTANEGVDLRRSSEAPSTIGWCGVSDARVSQIAAGLPVGGTLSAEEARRLALDLQKERAQRRGDKAPPPDDPYIYGHSKGCLNVADCREHGCRMLERGDRAPTNLWSNPGKMDREREQLIELHLLATQHNPRPVDPEKAKAFRERMAKIDPVTALSNVMKALEPQEDDEVLARAGLAWDAWDAEREPHAKAVLQMRLATHVAGLMEQVEALTKRRPETAPPKPDVVGGFEIGDVIRYCTDDYRIDAFEDPVPIVKRARVTWLRVSGETVVQTSPVWLADCKLVRRERVTPAELDGKAKS